MAEVVLGAEWQGFPGETSARRRARADIAALDGTFQEPADPDWLIMAEVFKTEEVASDMAAESAIYDYEVEMQKPVPAFEKTGLRHRAKGIMGRAADMLRETSVSVAATVQAKAEDIGAYYSDNEKGSRRRKIACTVAGAMVLGGLVYMEYKGLSGSTAAKETHLTFKPHHHEHVRRLAEAALHPGDNPWTLTEDHLHAHGVAHPSDARILADDKRLLKLNHISKLQAFTLQVGDKLKLLKNW